MKILIFIITFMACFSFLFSDFIPYISPGLSFGWDFRNGLTLSPKISIGIVAGNDFYNLTYGWNFPAFRNYKESYENHKYLQFQVGIFGGEFFGDKHVPLYFGGGIGYIYYKQDDLFIYAPKITAFSGFWTFLKTDFILLNKKVFVPNLGIQPVFPIPLRDVDIFSFS